MMFSFAATRSYFMSTAKDRQTWSGADFFGNLNFVQKIEQIVRIFVQFGVQFFSESLQT